MQKMVRVYDLPTRVFHWIFVVGFLGAYAVAQLLDDESKFYPFHMFLGMILVLSVGLRIIWGFLGSPYARFSSFALRPSALLAYLRELPTAQGRRWLGHNPASSWAAVAMMSLALGLGATGFLMAAGGESDFIEEAHELMANAFMFVAVAHVLGLAFHSYKHRDGLGLSMLSGQKVALEGTQGGVPRHAGVAIVFVVLIGAFVFYLNQNYDSRTQSLTLLGSHLQLGETEDDHHD